MIDNNNILTIQQLEDCLEIFKRVKLENSHHEKLIREAYGNVSIVYWEIRQKTEFKNNDFVVSIPEGTSPYPPC